MTDSQTQDIEKILDQEDRDPILKALDREIRRRIHEKINLPEETSPYILFDLTPRASNDEIKKRYHLLSKTFHPDHFFRKELGPYKRRLETIFSRIQKAYALLKNPIEKEALDRRIAFQNKTPKSTPLKDLKMSPEMERMGKAETFYKLGLEQEKNQNYLEAYNAFVAAIKIIPNRKIYTQAKDRVQGPAFRERSKDLIKLCQKKIKDQGFSEEVFSQLDDIFRMDSQSVECQALLAQAIVALRKIDRLRDAKEMLLRAKSVKPMDLDIQLSLAKALVLFGDNKGAEREARNILKQDEQHADALKFLDKLKQLK